MSTQVRSLLGELRCCLTFLLSSGAEHFYGKEEVVGSNPTGGSKGLVVPKKYIFTDVYKQ